MTHGGIIYFNSIVDRDRSLKILKNFNVFKLNFFETKILSNTRIFYRIKINSKIIFTNKTKNINKYLFSDKKKNIFKKKILLKIINFFLNILILLNQLAFIQVKEFYFIILSHKKKLKIKKSIILKYLK